MPALVFTGIIVGVSAIALWHLVSPIRLVFDEWMFVADRHEWTVDAVLVSHNGHPVVLQAPIYLVSFSAFGMANSWFLQAVFVLLRLALCAVLALRVGRRHGIAVGVGTWILTCFMTVTSGSIFWPFQMGWDLSLLFFVVSIEALDRYRRNGRITSAILASVFVLLSVMGSAVGLAALVAVGTVEILSPRRRSTWWVAVVPLVIFLGWRANYNDEPTELSSLSSMLSTLWEALARPGSVLVIGSTVIGGALVVSILGAVAAGIVRRSIPVTRLYGPLFLMAFVAMTLATRAEFTQVRQLPWADRYVYVSVVGLVIALSDLSPKAESMRLRAAVGAAAIFLAVGSAAVGYSHLVEVRDFFTAVGAHQAARLTVIDAHPDEFDDGEPVSVMFGVPLATLGDYRAASLATGSSAGFSSTELISMDPETRAAAEALMLPLLRVEASDDQDCNTVVMRAQSITLAPGGSAVIEATSPAAIIASRWLEPEPDRGGGGLPLARRAVASQCAGRLS